MERVLKKIGRLRRAFEQRCLLVLRLLEEDIFFFRFVHVVIALA